MLNKARFSFLSKAGNAEKWVWREIVEGAEPGERVEILKILFSNYQLLWENYHATHPILFISNRGSGNAIAHIDSGLGCFFHSDQPGD